MLVEVLQVSFKDAVKGQCGNTWKKHLPEDVAYNENRDLT